MTNEEKFKSIEERHKAFRAFCKSQGVCGVKCPAHGRQYGICRFRWLALEAEAEEKPDSCPFCGSPCAVVIRNEDIAVACSECNYQFGNSLDRDATIAAHNRVARAVREYKESEVTK